MSAVSRAFPHRLPRVIQAPMSPRRTPAATTATGKPTRARPSRSRSVMSNLHSIVPCEQSHRRLEVGPDLPVAGLAPGRGRSRDRTMAAPPGRGNPTTTRRRQGTGQLPRARKTSRRRVTLGQVSGAWAGRPAHGIPCSVCADRAARPDLRREDIATARGRRSGPLAGSGRRRCQVRWSLFHPTPPGFAWAHDGARNRSRHRTSSRLRSPGLVKAVVPPRGGPSWLAPRRRSPRAFSHARAVCRLIRGVRDPICRHPDKLGIRGLHADRPAPRGPHRGAVRPG